MRNFKQIEAAKKKLKARSENLRLLKRRIKNKIMLDDPDLNKTDIEIASEFRQIFIGEEL